MRLGGHRGAVRRGASRASAAALFALGGCGSGSEEGAATTQPPDAVIEWSGEIGLAETEQALSVLPRVRLDPAGGFLVADEREAQLRRYAPDGALAWHFGRRGKGPGEFEAPVAVARMPDGAILAADRHGRLTFLDPAGKILRGTVETGVRRVEDLLVLDDSTVLLSGVLEGSAADPRLHRWNLVSDTLLGGFFAPVANAANPAIAAVAGWTRVARRGDTLVATFAASDTLYFLTLEGEPLRQVPLPSRHFRRGPPAAPDRVLTRPEEHAAFLSRVDLVEGVFWLADGTLLVPYQSPVSGTERRRHLLHLTAGGDLLAETRDGPRLLAVEPDSRTLYFVHPEALAPNRLRLGRLRRRASSGRGRAAPRGLRKRLPPSVAPP